MREIFHGWRRRAGMVTLVVALAVVGLWVRSRILVEFILVPVGPRFHSAMLTPGRLVYFSSPTSEFTSGFDWYQVPVSDVTAKYVEEAIGDARQDLLRAKNGYVEFHINLALTAALLTLLSAYLIPWKPRKQQPTASKPNA